MPPKQYFAYLKLLSFTLFAMLLIWSLFLHLNPNKGSIANYLFNIGYSTIYLLGSAIATASLLSRRSPTIRFRSTLACFALGMLIFALGLLTWAYHNLILKTEVPYPSLSDLFFLTFYPLCIAAYLLYLKCAQLKFNLKTIIESAVLLSVLFFIVYQFISYSNSLTLPSPAARILNILYPLFDMLLVTLAILGLRSKTHEATAIYPILGFIALATADTMFSFRSAHELYWNGDVSDLAFSLAGLLLNLSIISIVQRSTTRSIPANYSSASPAN